MPVHLSRRTALAGLAGTAAALLPTVTGARTARHLPADAPSEPRTHALEFRAAARKARLIDAEGPQVELWTYTDQPLPVIRARRGDRMQVTLRNDLPEHTSVHWHGLRLPVAMDGVPYVTQTPVQLGESFTYEFDLPDTGSFFFHPHCNETGQVGRGMAGMLVVDGDARVRPDADIVLAVKDWRLAPDGSFLPFVTEAGASKAGTFGTLRSVNGKRSERIEVPAGGLIRLRLYNIDSTRVIAAGFDAGKGRLKAALIAVDGHRLPPVPFGRSRGLETWKMGPAMRADLLVEAPAPGETLTLNDYQGAEIFTIATLVGVDRKVPRRRGFDPDILLPGGYPLPRLAGAERLEMMLGAATGVDPNYLSGFKPGDPLAGVLMDALCVRPETFWSIDGKSWPGGDHRNIPPPLATLVAGRSYVISLHNHTPHPHPIHLHGHVFRAVVSDIKTPAQFDADTVLISPHQTAEIAFVAAAGDWMFHCHILDHLETGMMGYIRVV